MASESINSRARATEDSLKFLVERHPPFRLVLEQLIEWHCPVPTHKASVADAEAGIELQDAEPARPPGARGRARRPLGRLPLRYK
ncbi:unnamed protein product [Penicillium viridicatum]